MKGCYILLIELPQEESIAVGSLSLVRFPGSYYAYVGSALGGLEPRLNRHLSTKKKLRWHIDYLLQKAAINAIMICETDDRVECAIARSLSRRYEAIPDFGSSDCRCPSHLFISTKEMKPEIMTAMKSLLLDVRVF